MAIYAIIALPGPSTAKLPDAIRTAYPDAFHKLTDAAWLVAGDGSAKDVSDKVGITGQDSPNGSAIVVEMASYYGRGNPAIWSWVKNNWEATGG